MTTLDHVAPTTQTAIARPALAARMAVVVARCYRAWKNRREFYRLGEMTDTELADIGLRRTDLLVAIDIPFGSDPTTRLRVITEERYSRAAEYARRFR